MNELKQLCDGLAQSLEELAALLRDFPTEAEHQTKLQTELQAELHPLPYVDIDPAQVNDDPMDAINQYRSRR